MLTDIKKKMSCYSSINNVWGNLPSTTESNKDHTEDDCNKCINHIIQCEYCYQKLEKSFQQKHKKTKLSDLFDKSNLILVIGIVLMIILLIKYIFASKPAFKPMYQPIQPTIQPMYQPLQPHLQSTYSPTPSTVLQLPTMNQKWGGNYSITFSPNQ